MKTRILAGLAGLTLAALHGAPAHAQDAAYCREYTRKVVIGNIVQNAYGTACRQPDGSWQIVNQQQGDQMVEPVPPPPQSQVTYVVQDQQPVYVEPRYVTYAPWGDDYVYGYPFYYGSVGYYGGHSHGYYDGGDRHGYGGRGGYGGQHGGYGRR